MTSFRPFVGKRFPENQTLLVGESTYSWRENGELKHPSNEICAESVRYAIENFENSARFFRQITKALCGTPTPRPAEIAAAWDEYAYAVYVQESVGEGAGVRPTPVMFERAKAPFRKLLDGLQPKRVVVFGMDCWRNMPTDTDQYLCRDVQSYRLPSGASTWCLALPHPANRQDGFNWTLAHQSMKAFRRIRFP
jgi:hypothetical protein